MTRYQHLATLLAERIEQGLYRHGEKLPSVRSLSQEHGVSISTVQQAYQLLEQQQMIVPQPRSGYFVAPRKAQPPVPPMSRPVQRPVEITQWDQVLTMLDARYDKSIIPFGGGSPDVTQPSLKPIWRELSRAIQHNLTEVLNYDELAGRRELREQIARLMLDGGSVVTADDLVLTSGCHSALSLALLSVCQPGDIIAVESPCYYGTMQMLRGLGLKTIEIPTDPETGISIEALELALDQWPIKGVILVPNCNNPLGFIMPDARKRAVLNLAQRYDIVIFEDDIYGELATEYPRPRTIHSWDIDGRVMLCSSFTKTIAPGAAYRLDRPRALLRQAATDEVRRQRDQRPLHSAGGLQFYSRRPLPPPRAADAADLSAQYRDLHLLAAGIFPLRDLRHPAEGRFYAVG